MTEATALSFTPDWVSPPGDTIADILEEKDWTQTQFAQRLGYTTKHVSLLINGKAPITEETAVKLTKVLGSSEKFWLNREANYRAQLAQIEEKKLLESWVGWLEKLPVKELMKQGKIAKRRLDSQNKPFVVKDMLSFFGVASPEGWNKFYVGKQVAYRRTKEDQSDLGAITSWLRIGELEAEKQDCPNYNKSKFQKAVKAMRSLTVLPSVEFLPLLQQQCRESGVVFVLVRSIPRAHVSGVARWLNPHKALIQLSLYGKSNDRFWFTFFHEVAHILLHSKDDIFLDEWSKGKDVPSKQEEEANRWARDFLIPPKYTAELSNLNSQEQVRIFADRLGIHPGIVVGRLQHDKIIDQTCINGLKEKLDTNWLESS
ncbi:MAG: HigA family addiction module antitoxin [Xenococcus sp. (in: cyanobacteria)]